jgi:hypothetical protein
LSRQFKDGHRLVGVDRFDRAKPCILDDVRGSHAQHHFVLDDKDVWNLG